MSKMFIFVKQRDDALNVNLAAAAGRTGAVVVGVESLGDFEGTLGFFPKDHSIEKLTIWSHGEPGVLDFRGDRFDVGAIRRFNGKGFADLFADDARIIFDGCQVGAGAKGRDFVKKVARVFLSTPLYLSDISGKRCRDYVKWRTAQQRRSSKPEQTGRPARPITESVARRGLEDLRAAINYHRQDDYCSEIVSVVLPDKPPPPRRVVDTFGGRTTIVGRMARSSGHAGQGEVAGCRQTRRPVYRGRALQRHPIGGDLRGVIPAGDRSRSCRCRARRIRAPRQGHKS
jgi:hypothetical protein